jgi:hypothetical protein
MSSHKNQKKMPTSGKVVENSRAVLIPTVFQIKVLVLINRWFKSLSWT